MIEEKINFYGSIEAREEAMALLNDIHGERVTVDIDCRKRSFP